MDKKIEIPDAYSVPLEKMHPAEPALFKNNVMWSYFERLRKEDPVHYCKRPFDMGMGEFLDEEIGPYWSITKYNDIMDVDTNHKVFSSEPAITLFDPREEFTTPMFIAMDPPKHDVQRKAVNPVVAPSNLKNMEGLIRERTQNVLDNLPINESFDWVKSISCNEKVTVLEVLTISPTSFLISGNFEGSLNIDSQIISSIGDNDFFISKHDNNGNLISKKIIQNNEYDAHGNIQLSGSGALGDYLSNILKEKLKIGSFGLLEISYLFPCIYIRVLHLQAFNI